MTLCYDREPTRAGLKVQRKGEDCPSHSDPAGYQLSRSGGIRRAGSEVLKPVALNRHPHFTAGMIICLGRKSLTATNQPTVRIGSAGDARPIRW